MLTQLQITALQSKVYNLLMQNPELDMEAMGEAQEEARKLVLEWIAEHDLYKPRVEYLIQDQARRVVAVAALVGNDMHEFAMSCERAIKEHEVEEVEIRTVELQRDSSDGTVQCKMLESGFKSTYYLTKITIY